MKSITKSCENRIYIAGCVLALLIGLSCAPSDPSEITILLPGDVTLEMVRIPAGVFMMGSDETEKDHEPDEAPVHEVAIGTDFYMGKTELTQAQWLAVMGEWPDSEHLPNEEEGLGDDYPACYISWEDCQDFVEALNVFIEASGQGPAAFRMPTEAEWEYACRAGSQTRFSFGDSLVVDGEAVADLYMWHEGNTEPPGAKPVGQKLPNAWGLYDMHGNMWEWCQDWYHDSYEGAPADGSAWEEPAGVYRIMHGGDWGNKAHSLRSANRNDHRSPDERDADLGFRLVRDVR